MIPCSNRYGPLENVEGPCNTATDERTGTCMAVGNDSNTPPGLDKPLRLHDSLDLASVHSKLDEVKNLVLSLMNQLSRDPGVLCGCSCSQPRLDVPYPVMRGTPTIPAAFELRPQVDIQSLQPCPICFPTLPVLYTEGPQAPFEAIKHKRVINAEDRTSTWPNRSGKTTSADYNEDPGRGAIGSQVLSRAAPHQFIILSHLMMPHIWLKRDGLHL
ncbi:hypothetical protein NDU88_010597 [Pleurodeles waltl]|uniref:Uncharacterized protein n=1 Tax=Pleurodeles waltl TaxID=8319 RepID=A0AAV7QUW2_PLEWA|nr:hypothetical protein NDU88_010597 [Pleurodeles waltl]